MSLIEKFKESIENSTFCYAQTSGQGFTNKSNCQCHVENDLCCDAFFERNEFHKIYKELEQKGFSRKEIIEEVETMYKWDETSWIQYNVVK